MPEYVVVKYIVDRKVRIDGEEAGFTNDTLMVDQGHHTFDLGVPSDYRPTSVEKIVVNTTSVGPMIIDDFHPLRGKP